MHGDGSQNAATRRGYLRYGAALAGGSLLAGCTGGESSTPTADGTDSTGTDSPTPDSTEEPTASDTAYSVTIEPAGEVTFDSVPETWVAENASWADMGVALGLEKPSAVVLTGEYRTWHYDDVPGLSTSKEGMTSLWQDGISKELFLEIDAGVHLIDPNYMINFIPEWSR